MSFTGFNAGLTLPLFVRARCLPPDVDRFRCVDLLIAHPLRRPIARGRLLPFGTDKKDHQDHECGFGPLAPMDVRGRMNRA